MLLALERDLYQRAWHVFVQSEHTRASVISDYGVAPDRATAVMCGASVDIPTAPPARDWSSRRLLFVAEPRSFERKGGPTLVAAFAKVRAALPDATLTLVGPSPEQTGQQAGLTALGRIEDRARIAALYQAATCFALPTRQEPFGMVFTEAMAYRLPIVAARVDAVPELVQHERSGLVVEPDDPDALAAALIRVLSAPALAAQMGEAGYQHLQANLTWPRVVERVNRVLAQFEG
jgi:glycosyltransferase involved in cell wall biosynthesis